MDKREEEQTVDLELKQISVRKNDASNVDHQEKTRLQCKIVRQVLGILIMATAILLAWGFLLFPLLFYHLEIKKDANPVSSIIAAVSDSDSTCTSSYNTQSIDSRCRSALYNVLVISNCLKGDEEEDIYVIRNGDQLVSQIFQGLEFLRAPGSCMQEAVPFICLYAYGVCSSSGIYLQPTSSQCEELRDSLCRVEWEAAINIGIALPYCGDFPDMLSARCLDSNNSTHLNSSEPDQNGVTLSSKSDILLDCSDGFYRENSSRACIPDCYSWSQYERNLSEAITAVVILVAVVGSIAAVSNLVISFLKPKRMCTFPAIFVVYMVVDSLVAGISFTYILLQLALWWVFHASSIFWSICFPFHFQSFKAARRLKYVHVAFGIAGLLLPLVTTVTTISEHAAESQRRADNNTSASSLFLSGGLGYSTSTFPPILCTTTDEDAGFFSLILPVCVIQSFGNTLLIITLWRIHSQHQSNSTSSFKFGTPEKKLLVVILYFELLGIIALITFTLSTKYDEEFVQSVLDLFKCEQMGHNPEDPCSLSDINRLGFSYITLLSYVILGSFPVVILVYAINSKDLKEVLEFLKIKLEKLKQKS